MPFSDQDMINFILISLLSLLSLSWLFLLFAFISPQKAIYIAGMFSNSHSLEKELEPLEKPIYTERFIYRHHRLFGSVFVLFSLYILWQLSTAIDVQTLVELFKEYRDQVIAEILLKTLQLVLWIGSLFSLIVGVIVLIRPSLLKKMEAKSNYWISTQTLESKLNKENKAIDKYFQQKTHKIVIPLLTVCTLLIFFLGYIATTLRLG